MKLWVWESIDILVGGIGGWGLQLVIPPPLKSPTQATTIAVIGVSSPHNAQTRRMYRSIQIRCHNRWSSMGTMATVGRTCVGYLGQMIEVSVGGVGDRAVGMVAGRDRRKFNFGCVFVWVGRINWEREGKSGGSLICLGVGVTERDNVRKRV